MSKKLIYLISFAVLLIAASSVQALTTVTTADANGADTYLSNDGQSGNYGPTSTHGTEGGVAIRRYDGTRMKLGLIRFDITGITGSLTGATLSFNVTSSNRTRVWGIYGLVDETRDNWDEATTSYNTAPGFIPNPPTSLAYYAIDPNLQKLGTISIGSAGASYYTSNTTDLPLDIFIGSDTNKRLTLAIIPDSTDNNASWNFTSRQGSASLATMLTFPNALRPPASYPNPADASMVYSITVPLQWQRGAYAAQHDIYLADNFNDVNSANSSSPQGPDKVYKARQDANSYTAAGLAFGTTYYWRIDEVNGVNIWRGNIWRFTVVSLIAYNPTPPDSSTYVAPKMTLRWRAGSGAIVGHNVYLSDNFNDVNNAPVGSTALPFRKFLTPTADPNWNPAQAGVALGFNKTYYWRIDEVQSTSPQIIHKGTVWSFTTVPNPPTEPNLVGWWKLDEDVTDSGYGCNGTEIGGPTYVDGFLGRAIYINNGNNTNPADDIYVSLPLGSVISTLTNSTFALWVNLMGTEGDRRWQRFFSFGTGPTNFMVLSPRQSSSPPTYFEITTGGVTQRVSWGPYSTTTGTMITANEWHHLAVTISEPNASGIRAFRLYVDGAQVSENLAATLTPSNLGFTTQNWLGRCEDPATQRPYRGYLDDFRIYNRALSEDEIKKIIIPPEASVPTPADGATDVSQTPTLGWTPGGNVADVNGHQLYFADNFEDVNSRSVSQIVLTDPCYLITTPLVLGKTYYWAVDEVNDANLWPGDVWSFTTVNYLTVDDYERYTNTPPDIIWQTWIPSGGGKVGYNDANYAEVTIIHGGRQSMPFDYNNLNPPSYSEASRTFNTQQEQDWTQQHVKALSLWFRGYPASVGSFVENPAGVYTMTASGADIWNVSDLTRPSRFHDEFRYAYMQVSGDYAIAVKVESITNTNDYAKAGVMIRDSKDANSANVMTCITPSSAGGIRLQHRATAGGTSITDVNVANINAPYWISLTRQGNSFTAGYSLTGEQNTWTSLGSTSLTMTDPVCIGLALTARNATATASCTAVFSNVGLYIVNPDNTLTPVTPSWTSHDIGIISNTRAPLYVTLRDLTNTATVTHTDANAVLNPAWQAWDIPISSFTGVNTSAIKKLTIGVGTQSVATGTIYVDDIRLYIPRCMPDRTEGRGDVTNDCFVDYYDLVILADNWLIKPASLVNSGLEAYYQFENNLQDSSGNGHHGSDPCGTTAYAPGKVGQALSLNGVDAYVSVGPVGIDSNDPRTIAGWAKMNTTIVPVWTNVFGFTNNLTSGQNGRSFDIEVVGGTTTTTAGYYGIHVSGWEQNILPPDLEWHHLAASYDGTTIRWYGNGRFVGQQARTLNTLDNIQMGKRGDNNNRFAGLIDEVRIYRRALSRAEIEFLAGNPMIDINKDGVIDFRDYGSLANMWLEEVLWPQ